MSRRFTKDRSGIRRVINLGCFAHPKERLSIDFLGKIVWESHYKKNDIMVKNRTRTTVCHAVREVEKMRVSGELKSLGFDGYMFGRIEEGVYMFTDDPKYTTLFLMEMTRRYANAGERCASTTSSIDPGDYTPKLREVWKAVAPVLKELKRTVDNKLIPALEKGEAKIKENE